MQKKSSHTPLFNWLVNHPKTTFVLMALTFIVFGAMSINMVNHVAANANYLMTYRWDALMDGGILQLLELWVQVFLALGSYVIFKLCEHALIERIAHHSYDEHHAELDAPAEMSKAPAQGPAA